MPALRSVLLELRGDLESALRSAERAIALDPAHLIAARRVDRLATVD